MKDNFRFFIPATICKGGVGEEEDDDMYLEGVASTSSKDRQGEFLFPEGFDFNILQNYGFINWHHQADKNPSAIIGEPVECRLTEANEFFVKGMLYKESDIAKEAYKLAGVLSSNSKTRRLGWSVEGKATKRDPINKAKVLKADITGLALTYMPINADSFASITKAMVEGTFKGIGDEELLLRKSISNEANGGKTYILDITLPDGQEIKITDDKNVKLDLRRAITTGNGGGLIKESVEKKLRGEGLSKADVISTIVRKSGGNLTADKLSRLYGDFLLKYAELS